MKLLLSGAILIAALACLPVAVVLGSLSGSVDVTLHEYEDDCAKQTGVTAASIEAARVPRRMPETGELDAFSVCMLKKFKIMNNDDTVNPNSRSYQIFSDNVYLNQISDGCKVLAGSSTGETARKIMNCYLSANELVMALIPRKV